jgi:NAD(P)-dependent dehydrogenase (short-subunit alcohol dehydrogenase family)
VARTAVITGASAGVGRAVVRELARRGDRLALLARGEAGLAAAAEDARALGAGAVLTHPTDVGDAAQVAAAARAVDAQLGPPDLWVNNAMNSVFAHSWDITAEEYRRVTEVTYLGYVYGTLEALARMRPRNAGTIVFVGSALAYRGIPLQAAYCGAKHAIAGFRDSVRTDLLSEGSKVRVTTVNLPAVNTPQFGWVRTRLPRHPQPVPPIYTPEVAARAIVWAAEHAPRELDLGYATVLTRRANAVAPGLLARYLARNALEDQQTDEPIDHDTWQDNLETPRDDAEDVGAAGRFTEEATDRAPTLWLATHRPQVAAGALATAGALLGLLARKGGAARG